ncbi:MAG: Rrf2 family transcriptional regulator [Thermodesulfobacteriota bacterium]|nr:Rrf2 family transcriptional regulator [Thermodesulfobacteriota bacterium]
MKISSRGRYILRAMIELGINFGGKPISLKNIALNQNISEKYLTQLMGIMKRAGLVRLKRGVGGGYILVRDPVKITLAQILYPIEGDMSLIDCISDPVFCIHSDDCYSRPVWLELSRLIKNYLESTTLEDAIKKIR